MDVECGHCHSAAHVVVLMHLHAAPEPLSDLMPEESRANFQFRITADDVLDMHQLLQEFDGDFEALFA